MRRQRTIVVLAACVLILITMGMMSYNCFLQISQGCPLSQTMQCKAPPCLRNAVASSLETGIVVLPAATPPVVPEPIGVFYARAIESVQGAINPSIEEPPLRC